MTCTFSLYYCLRIRIRANVHTRATYLVLLCFITGIFGEILHHPSQNLIEPDVRRMSYVKNQLKRFMRESSVQEFDEPLRTKSIEETEPIAEFGLPAHSYASKEGKANIRNTINGNPEYIPVSFARGMLCLCISILLETLALDTRARRTDHKEDGPSLSIVNSLDVLRKSLLMELSRRKMEVDEKQKQINAELLKIKG